MNDTHGISRRCEIKASCGQEAFKATFETLGSNVSHETRFARLLAASHPKGNPYTNTYTDSLIRFATFSEIPSF